MTLQELYLKIDGDYDSALKVLLMDKLIDKHIRKLPSNGVIDNLLEAGKTKDPTQLFEAAHAAKGVTANLGLLALSADASEIAEEYRPGNPRTHTDEEIDAILDHISELYEKTLAGIRQYE